eukprot:m.5114 g.5114  ORF g.5114 m.5114 type:complete len:422 (-) comp1974_c0_seq1:868-2133(-)
MQQPVPDTVSVSARPSLGLAALFGETPACGAQPTITTDGSDPCSLACSQQACPAADQVASVSPALTSDEIAPTHAPPIAVGDATAPAAPAAKPAPALGMVGLGRMGGNIVRRLARSGIFSVLNDVQQAMVGALADELPECVPSASMADMAAKLPTPRVVWVMVPASVADVTIASVAAVLDAGDIVIDGGNSYYRNDVENARKLAERGIHFVDVGTSGGVHGLERGYSLMIGGETAIVQHLDPIFRALAPGMDAAERTPGRTGEPATSELGYFHCGPSGAGHYVKMIHNGIEYGMMAAFAEGLGIFEAAKHGTPQYNLDLSHITEVWRRGSVVASWLLDLIAHALQEDPGLTGYSTAVSDSGEGRWTVQAAIELGIPAHVLSASLFSRFASRDNDDYANRVLSAMRKKFGGHNETHGKPASS